MRDIVCFVVIIPIVTITADDDKARVYSQVVSDFLNVSDSPAVHRHERKKITVEFGTSGIT